MKIRMSFGIVKTVIIAVALVAAFAVIGLDIAILAGAEGMTNANPAIPAVSMVAGLLIVVACMLLLLNSFYKFKEQGFTIMLGFFADKIAYDEVVLVKQDIESSELYMIVKNKSTEIAQSQIALKVNVARVKTDDFLKELRAHIPNVTVELFTKPKKKKKDN